MTLPTITNVTNQRSLITFLRTLHGAWGGSGGARRGTVTFPPGAGPNTISAADTLDTSVAFVTPTSGAAAASSPYPSSIIGGVGIEVTHGSLSASSTFGFVIHL